MRTGEGPRSGVVRVPVNRGAYKSVLVLPWAMWSCLAGCSSSSTLPPDGGGSDAANEIDGWAGRPDASSPVTDAAVDGGSSVDGRAVAQVDRFATLDREFRQFACPCTFSDWEYPSETDCVTDTTEVDCMRTAFADPVTDRDFEHLSCVVEANAAYLDCLEPIADCSDDDVVTCQDSFADAYLSCPPPEDSTFDTFGACLGSG